MNSHQRLALAIIEQGVEDLECDTSTYNTPRDKRRYKREAWSFFHSEWYEDLADFVGVGRRTKPLVVHTTAASQFGASNVAIEMAA